MRALLPVPADDVDVHAFYAADWVEAGGLRVNFVSSVDGAAQASPAQSRMARTPRQPPPVASRVPKDKLSADVAEPSSS